MELHNVSQHQSNGVGTMSTPPTVSQQRILNPETVSRDMEAKFISANTNPVTLEEIRDKHTIPVFVKDNTPSISQVDFIESTMEIAYSFLKMPLENLAVRVSHPIKGRIFSARHKKPLDLLEHEKTIYYERMAFAFEIPYFKEEVNGEELTLTVVGVKAYNTDNLYAYGGGLQKFKIGIGYKVKVCTNLCVFTDGCSLEIKVRSLEELRQSIVELFASEAYHDLLPQLNGLDDFGLTERQFATLLGRMRLYHHLPLKEKKKIPRLLLSDSQVSSIAKEYFNSETFNKNPDGSISLWNLFNLMTNACKSSYIDSYLDKNVNAFAFSSGVYQALEGKGEFQWFLS